MSMQTMTVSVHDAGERLSEIYHDNFQSNRIYNNQCVYFKSELLNYYHSESDLIFHRAPKVTDFIDLAGYFLEKQKISKLIYITDGWTLLAFDIMIKKSIRCLTNYEENCLIKVPKKTSNFLKEFISTSDQDISVLSQKCS